MKKPRTVWLSQPLYPNSAQQQALRRHWARALSAQHMLSTYLSLRAAGHSTRLVDAATNPGSLPSLPSPETTVVVPPFPVAELQAEFRQARDALGWARDVPASVYHQVVADTARDWRAFAGRAVRVSELPPAWGPERPLELHLNGAAQPLDQITVEVASLGKDALILGDLYLLPGPYRRALHHRQQRRLAHEAQRLQQFEQAWLAGDDLNAAGQAYRLRARHLAAGVVLEDQRPPLALGPGEPRSLDRAVIRQTTGLNGQPGWEISWAFQIAATPWTTDDCLGLDPGGRHVVAYAAHTGCGVIQRPLRGAWQLPALPAPRGLLEVPLDETRARIYHRRALFLKMLPTYDAFLALALQFRVVALEDTSWHVLRHRGSKFPAYAEAVGLRAALRWLMDLAPHHGVQVRLTPPYNSSRTCPACLKVGRRPWSGRPFACHTCGHTETIGDVAAAQIHRMRALSGSWRAP
ncbi:zinc ribbon domain-containing protein [Deinococcus marmoris]